MGRKVVEGRGRMARRLGSAVRWVRGGERGRDQASGLFATCISTDWTTVLACLLDEGGGGSRSDIDLSWSGMLYLCVLLECQT